MFTQFSESDTQSDEEPCNIVAETIGCCTLLLRYLLCFGPRPARTRSQGVEAQEYTAPNPSSGSSNSRHSADAEPSGPSRSQQNEGQPLLKGSESSGPAGGSGQELQGFRKGILKYKEGLELGSSDEDVCPTCLESYTDENPAIETKCHHRYHLACIFEWLERSKTCPVCARKMEFEELL
jgi:hypothetical protein